jgi:DNA-directed RNA polymerase specialized sigma24 family protein
MAEMSIYAGVTTYTVRAKRWRRGWELHIDGLGVTQSRTLNDAEEMARDYIAVVTGAPPDSFSIEIVPEVGEGLDEETVAARRAVAEADQAQRAAASQSREVAAKLSGAGLSGREIAVVLHLSPQRVSQLLGRRRARTAGVQAAMEGHGETHAHRLPCTGSHTVPAEPGHPVAGLPLIRQRSFRPGAGRATRRAALPGGWRIDAPGRRGAVTGRKLATDGQR